MTMSNNNNADTKLTKVFVGGLAWETPKETLREHFEKYGEILEAVIISDKATGRSKGYGFVTFKEAEAAKKACQDTTPIINGRRANCNLAAFGAARRPIKASYFPQQGAYPGLKPTTVAKLPPPHANRVQWYYHAPARTQARAFHHHHQHHLPVPYYGYNPAYIATNHLSYNHKLGYTGGSYMNGLYSQVYPTQHMLNGNTLMPVYPPHYRYHPQSQILGLGLPAHFYPQGPQLMSQLSFPSQPQ